MKDTSLSDVKRCGWAVVVVLGLVYLGSIGPHWKVSRDSAVFIGIGQSIIEGRGYTFGGEFLGGTPFGWPVLLAGLLRLFGQDYLLLNTVSVLLGLATLWLVYSSVKEMAGAWWGLIVVTLTGLLHVTLNCSGYLLTDMPAAFGFWLGFYFLQRLVLQPTIAWRDVLGASAGLLLVCAFRFTGLFFLPVFALAPWLRRPDQRADFGKNLLLAAVMVLPAVLLLAWWIEFSMKLAALYGVSGRPVCLTWSELIDLIIHPLRGFWPVMLSLMDAVLNGLTASAIPFGCSEAIGLLPPDYLNLVRIAAYGVGLVMCVLLGWGGWRIRKRDRGLILLAVLVYCGSFLVSQRSVDKRYLLPLFPFLVWFVAEGLNAVWKKLRRRQLAVQAAPDGFPLRWPTVACLVALLVPNLLTIAYEIRQAHRSDYYAPCEKGVWRYFWEVSQMGQLKEVWEVSQWIKQHTPPEARLFTREFALLHLWTGRQCLRLLELTRAGDLLVLERNDNPRNRFKQSRAGVSDWERVEEGKAWALVKNGTAKELYQTGTLSVHSREPCAPNQQQSSVQAPKGSH